MQYTTIRGINARVSRIAQGLMHVVRDEREESFALLDAVLKAGINLFDGAHVYAGGKGDRVFGEWVRSRGVRDKVILLDKVCHHNPDRKRVTPFDLAGDLHDLLARLQFDYIDILALHRDDPDVPVGEIVDMLNEQVAAGRARCLGASNWTHERIAEANEYAEEHGRMGFAVSSPHFSLAEPQCEIWKDGVSIAGASQAAATQWYADHDVRVVPWSSLSGGFFSGRFDRAEIESRPSDPPDYIVRCFRTEDNLARLDRCFELAASKGVSVPQVAVAWLLHHPVGCIPLLGARTPEEVESNAAATGIELTDAEFAYLDLRRDQPM
jgi:aryl-alcohol dehydrogenase-like predicted oxidoreductase